MMNTASSGSYASHNFNALAGSDDSWVDSLDVLFPSSTSDLQKTEPSSLPDVSASGSCQNSTVSPYSNTEASTEDDSSTQKLSRQDEADILEKFRYIRRKRRLTLDQIGEMLELDKCQLRKWSGNKYKKSYPGLCKILSWMDQPEQKAMLRGYMKSEDTFSRTKSESSSQAIDQLIQAKINALDRKLMQEQGILMNWMRSLSSLLKNQTDSALHVEVDNIIAQFISMKQEFHQNLREEYVSRVQSGVSTDNLWAKHTGKKNEHSKFLVQKLSNICGSAAVKNATNALRHMSSLNTKGFANLSDLIIVWNHCCSCVNDNCQFHNCRKVKPAVYHKKVLGEQQAACTNQRCSECALYKSLRGFAEYRNQVYKCQQRGESQPQGGPKLEMTSPSNTPHYQRMGSLSSISPSAFDLTPMSGYPGVPSHSAYGEGFSGIKQASMGHPTTSIVSQRLSNAHSNLHGMSSRMNMQSSGYPYPSGSGSEFYNNGGLTQGNPYGENSNNKDFNSTMGRREGNGRLSHVSQAEKGMNSPNRDQQMSISVSVSINNNQGKSNAQNGQKMDRPGASNNEQSGHRYQEAELNRSFEPRNGVQRNYYDERQSQFSPQAGGMNSFKGLYEWNSGQHIRHNQSMPPSYYQSPPQQVYPNSFYGHSTAASTQNASRNGVKRKSDYSQNANSFSGDAEYKVKKLKAEVQETDDDDFGFLLNEADQGQRVQDKPPMARQMMDSSDSNQKMLCVICQQRERAIVFSPCKHCCSCQECASNLSSCPICRSGILSTSHIYLP